MAHPSSEFRELYVGNQSRIYAYILTLLADPDSAADVLQETNMVLWEKADQFKIGTSFTAWSLEIARFKIMEYTQRSRRDRLVFSDKAMKLIQATAIEQELQESDQRTLLERCLGLLSNKSRHMLSLRYSQDLSLKQIADQLERSYSATCVTMHRIRVQLADCIKQSEATDG